MKIKTNIKAGGMRLNHNETLVRDGAKAKGLRVKTGVKAGGHYVNNNETLVRGAKPNLCFLDGCLALPQQTLRFR